MRIGLISDTHGLLRPRVFDAFRGVDLILHAGDIGSLDILVALEAVAPVAAVWGNTDGLEIRAAVDEVVEREAAGRTIVVTHGHQLGSPEPVALKEAHPSAGVIVYGHTHRPRVERAGETLVVNPGGAGASRFGLTPSVAILELAEEEPGAGGEDFRLIELEAANPSDQ